jgi:hypothetical protein
LRLLPPPLPRQALGLEVPGPERRLKGGAMAESRERLARNQAVFREINERIETMLGPNDSVDFVCECSNPDCTAALALTVEEYEDIRSEAAWFVIIPGHNFDAIERVVFESDEYAIVEKMMEREFAEEVDSRFN